MAKTPLRIGLVGTGRGSVYGRLFAELADSVIVACCDTDPRRMEQFQRELGLSDSACFCKFDRFLDTEMDAVVIGTPMDHHAPGAIAALKAGFHVLSEVTAASSVAECEQLVDAVRRTGKTYMMAENCVYWPFIQQWIDIVAEGRLGDIFYCECEYLHPIEALIVDPSTGQQTWRAKQPPLHYCTHSLGPILEITKDRIVRAMGIGQGNRLLPGGGLGGIDIQVALFQTERNALIKMLRSSIAPREPSIHFYLLQGTNGFIETDRKGPGGKGWLYVKGEMAKAESIDCSFTDESLPEAVRQIGHGSAEYGVAREFLDAIKAGRQPSLNELRAVQLTAPGLIAHESAARGGVWLDVPSFQD